MTNRIILAALAAIIAAPGLAKPAPATAIVAPQADIVKIAIETDKGRIVVALDAKHAPLTTANFLAYVDKHLLDGQPFYRAMPLTVGGLIQGGSRDGAMCALCIRMSIRQRRRLNRGSPTGGRWRAFGLPLRARMSI